MPTTCSSGKEGQLETTGNNPKRMDINTASKLKCTSTILLSNGKQTDTKKVKTSKYGIDKNTRFVRWVYTALSLSKLIQQQAASSHFDIHSRKIQFAIASKTYSNLTKGKLIILHIVKSTDNLVYGDREFRNKSIVKWDKKSFYLVKEIIMKVVQHKGMKPRFLYCFSTERKALPKRTLIIKTRTYQKSSKLIQGIQKLRKLSTGTILKVKENINHPITYKRLNPRAMDCFRNIYTVQHPVLIVHTPKINTTNQLVPRSELPSYTVCKNNQLLKSIDHNLKHT